MQKIKNTKGQTTEITQEQYDELFGKGGKAFRAERGGEYWMVHIDGNVEKMNERGGAVDNYLYLTGNYFRTEAEAIAYKALQEATGRVTHAINEANGGWEPDGTHSKWSFFLNDNHFHTDVDMHNINAYTLPYLKPDTAEKILEEHEEDLRVIFGVK